MTHESLAGRGKNTEFDPKGVPNPEVDLLRRSICGPNAVFETLERLRARELIERPIQLA